MNKITYLTFKNKKGKTIAAGKKEESQDKGSKLEIWIDVPDATADQTTEENFNLEVKKIKSKQ